MQNPTPPGQKTRRRYFAPCLWPCLPCSLLLVAVAGCVSPAKDKAAAKESDKKVEYVYYTPTGSNIPVLIRKDQLEADERQAARDQEALRSIQQKTRRADKAPGG